VVLGQAGYELIIVDNLSNSHESTLKVIQSLTGKKIKFYEVDIRNYEDLEKIFKKHAEEI
jgi:UDP-glucose 4-epimerase